MYIYNSFTKRKEKFTPLVPNKVNMYVCGMTVYDYCHLGHGRVLVGFDMVARYLRYKGYEVNYVRNITDIDDKIINRANEKGETYQQLTAYFIQAMHEDSEALNVLPVTQEPRATDYIHKIIELIKRLEAKGYAYVGTNGDVFYAVDKFAAYGHLSHRHLETLQTGARIAIDEAKRNPLDFVLWKMAKPEEPAWDSPWGKGRPGWHIECSAMSMDTLGETFDIHGGGFDLKFPHHENEIAQSEAATEKPFVNLWMHMGFITVNREKMSKSLDNFFTIRELLATYEPEVIRYFLLSSHYRSPINYSEASLEIAQGALERLYLTLRGLTQVKITPETNTVYEQRFNAAMDDDFNTPLALSVLFDLCHDINRLRDQDPAQAAQLASLLKHLGQVLGLLATEPDVFLQNWEKSNLELAEIETLIREREKARSMKAWQQADKIRDQLADQGILIADTPAGTVWRCKRH